jgi:hypothetical protein
LHALPTSHACAPNDIRVTCLNIGLLVGTLETKYSVFTGCTEPRQWLTKLLQVELKYYDQESFIKIETLRLRMPVEVNEFL